MKRIVASLMLFAGSPALSEELKLRELCSERPGLNTPACTVDPGHLQIELGLGDWTMNRQSDQREDRIETGQMLLRYGVGATTEVRFGWTAYGHVRNRDRDTGEIDRSGGIGDVTLSLKQNLRHPAEGRTGLAIALLPYATLPAGRKDVGDGDWGGGLIVPASYKFDDTVSLEFSPEVQAAVNESGSGRHFAYGSAMGVQVHLNEHMRLTPELQFVRDNDPEHHVTMSNAALSFDVQPAKMTQLDVQAVAGLNRNTPDVELSFGVTHKF
ncbi:transporter [Sphingomonas sp. AP4-R1]|uniref:transporter n=1 Tax=Sphingomonas sp. AP4-R1 TaxID=2735134 RepID=UPI0014933154|nr:transporter [Sphingomonas sp. AP4-R1]QJU59332.1 transporter [Sphingomonas sp. AP4-R1]